MQVRVQMGFPMNSALPRDVVTINPHYDTANVTALLTNLSNNIKNTPPMAGTTPFTLKAYDATKPPPNYPIASVTNGTGFTTPSYPPELSICLSYYATFNRPRFRGRLYIPIAFAAAGNPGARPSAGDRSTTAKWADILGKNLPLNDHWIVWSKVENSAQGAVSAWWVDDEWDHVRSRGLLSTARTTGTIP
jgi:hypothetical protein